jgi:hypothetical protein
VRLIHGILLLLLGILGLLVILLLTGDPPAATGAPHAGFPGMSSGGDGLARLGGLGWVMCLIQVLTLLLIHGLIALSITERHRSPLFWLLLGLCAFVSLAVWLGMYVSYIQFLETGDTGFVFGYPLSSALALFGVFLGGSLLCVLYIWGFRRFIYPEADEAAYEALRASAERPRKPDAPHGGSEL